MQQRVRVVQVRHRALHAAQFIQVRKALHRSRYGRPDNVRLRQAAKLDVQFLEFARPEIRSLQFGQLIAQQFVAVLGLGKALRKLGRLPIGLFPGPGMPPSWPAGRRLRPRRHRAAPVAQAFGSGAGFPSWLWMSTRSPASRRMAPRFSGVPLTNARERPSLPTTRRNRQRSG